MRFTIKGKDENWVKRFVAKYPGVSEKLNIYPESGEVVIERHEGDSREPLDEATLRMIHEDMEREI